MGFCAFYLAIYYKRLKANLEVCFKSNTGKEDGRTFVSGGSSARYSVHGAHHKASGLST